MTGADLSPARFGDAFKAFMEAVTAAAAPPNSPLLERIQAHLDADPTQLRVIAEGFDSFEHPNVQVALDAYLGGGARRADLVGVAADNKRFMAFGLSDLFSRGGVPGHPTLAEGPVDYVNFHLADSPASSSGFTSSATGTLGWSSSWPAPTSAWGRG
ncbi:MAG: hypothetical protein M3Q65_08965 [Chloroflexota bacterium]|nr:hypothetical protein [Chloroflexota bacterium]